MGSSQFKFLGGGKGANWFDKPTNLVGKPICRAWALIATQIHAHAEKSQFVVAQANLTSQKVNSPRKRERDDRRPCGELRLGPVRRPDRDDKAQAEHREVQPVRHLLVRAHLLEVWVVDARAA